MHASGMLKVLHSAGEKMAVALMTVTKCVAQMGLCNHCTSPPGHNDIVIGRKKCLLLSCIGDTGMNACSSARNAGQSGLSSSMVSFSAVLS